jgi:hypothetical protein
VLWPAVSPESWVVPPIALSRSYAVSLSVQQLVALLLILFLTFLNTLGLKLGKLIQNVFTSAKTLALLGLIVAGVLVGRNAEAIRANFTEIWTLHDPQTIKPGAEWLKSFIPAVTAASGAFGLLIAFGVAQVGSLFSADAWNNITFTAGEVKNPKRDIPLSLAAGTAIVITLYFLANVAYLCALPLHQIQTAPDDRVATATLAAIFGPSGATLMALAIMVSTFGCANGLILAGARVFPQYRPAECEPRAGDGPHAARRMGGSPGAVADAPGGLVHGLRALWKPLQCAARLRRFCSADFLCVNDRRSVCLAAQAPPCGAAVPRVGVSRRARALHRHGRCDHADLDLVSNAGHLAGAGDRPARRARVSVVVPACRRRPANA